MAGYFNYSMSNNAVSAYNTGEKPFSKWKKSDILECVQNFKNKDGFNSKFSVLKKMSAEDLKNMFLYKSSWHHTSKHYNKTNFFSIDELGIEDYFETDKEKKDRILKAELLKKQREEQEKEKEEQKLTDKETIKNLVLITDKSKLKGNILLYFKDRLTKVNVVEIEENNIIVEIEEKKITFNYEYLFKNPESKTKFFELK